ncbi:MAG TPA: hypothetical protein VID03_10275 [Acidimicrobiia bacterium]|jgi:hypothetical protein
MRSSDLTCALARKLTTYAIAGDASSAPLSGHVETCLRCQAYRAELSRRRRQLGELGGRVEAPPADLVDAIFADLDRPEPVGTGWVPWAGAAVALSVMVWLARRRLAA